MQESITAPEPPPQTGGIHRIRRIFVTALSLPDPASQPERATAPEVAPRIGARALCEALVARGVTTIFGYPGGAVLPISDLLPQFPIPLVLVRYAQDSPAADYACS